MPARWALRAEHRSTGRRRGGDRVSTSVVHTSLALEFSVFISINPRYPSKFSARQTFTQSRRVYHPRQKSWGRHSTANCRQTIAPNTIKTKNI